MEKQISNLKNVLKQAHIISQLMVQIVQRKEGIHNYIKLTCNLKNKSKKNVFKFLCLLF